MCYVRETFDKRAVKIEKAYCPSYFCDIFGCQPSLDSCNFYWVHACHPLFKDYPQVIHGWHMEKAFLWFEVEVMLLCYLKDILYCHYMVLYVSACCNADVIHVYMDCSTA